MNFKMGWEIELPRFDEVAKVVVKGRLKASVSFWEGVGREVIQKCIFGLKSLFVNEEPVQKLRTSTEQY